MLEIYVDADGCPAKDEVYRVAARYGLNVYVVSNRRISTPLEVWLKPVVVSGHFDAVDDWIAEHAGEDDIAVTADIPLAARCLERGACVLGPNGREFTEDSIGSDLASRDLMDQLRQMGAVTGGPAQRSKQDRSRFLSRLDDIIQAIRRRRGTPK